MGVGDGSCDEAEIVPSAIDWLLVSLDVMPSVVALALPLEVAPLVTYLCGAIVDLKETFWERLKGEKSWAWDSALKEITKNIEVGIYLYFNL